jgi:hypothetical protein
MREHVSRSALQSGYFGNSAEIEDGEAPAILYSSGKSQQRIEIGILTGLSVRSFL